MPAGGFAAATAAIDLVADDGEQAIDALAAAIAAAVPDASPLEIARGLRERESLGSTALGGGVALPHCRVAGLERSLVMVARSSAGVDFGAPDGVPVRLFVAIATPAERPGSHLRLLAAVARRLRDREWVERLLSSTAIEELAAAVLPAEPRMSA